MTLRESLLENRLKDTEEGMRKNGIYHFDSNDCIFYRNRLDMAKLRFY